MALPAPALSLAGLRVVILGRGRVGRALATGLAVHGATVTTTSGSGLLPAPPAATLIMLTVPDDAIAEVAQRLAAQVAEGQVVAHTSGRHGLAVLDPVRRGGAHALAFHPAMTFTGETGAAAETGPTGDAQRLAGVRIGLTADPGATQLAGRLCDALGATPTWVTEANRPLYHAALTHAANHLVTLIAEAQSLLVRAGVDDPSAVLAPLVGAALAGALDSGAFATTGPVVRGDAGTIGGHLRALGTAAPELLPTYTSLARATARLAAADGRLDRSAAARITDVLQGVPA